MKQKSGGIKRLMEFTGKHRGLLTVSRILSGVSSVFILGPFLCVYFAARELVAVFTGTPLDTQGLVRWGILALFLELIGLLLYFGALLCSHVVAFHTEKNLKMAALRHLAKMPMGYFDLNPSGKLRKIIDENSFQTETFIAHQLPDLVGAQVTMVISLILMLAFDWRVGVPLLLLFGIGFFLQGSLMGKDGMKFMQTYQDSLETMNHEAVEYIRGISVVKVFGQTVQSITKFHNAIKSYRKFALAYTMSCKKGMVAFNSVINSSFLVLVPTALIIGLVSADLAGFMQSFLFYLIFSPACAVIDAACRQVFWQGKFIELTPMEFDVFHLLARRPGRVFSQREIYEFAAPDSFDSSWTGISSIIYKLRHKLNADFIQTVYGKGYRFLPP